MILREWLVWCAWVMSRIWISHVAHVDGFCHIYECMGSHVAIVWLLRCLSDSHVPHTTWLWHGRHEHDWQDIWGCVESCRTFEAACHAYERVIAHMWMSPVTRMNESCHTYEWVISHIRRSHVTHRMSHVTHMNESWHIYEWVMSHIWMSHVTQMNESRHSHERVMSQIRMRMSHILNATYVNESNLSCHIHMNEV